MARDIRFLAQDLKIDLEEAISTAASEMYRKLKESSRKNSKIQENAFKDFEPVWGKTSTSFS